MVHIVDAAERVVGLIVVATLAALIATVAPVTAAQAHDERERELALQAQHAAEEANVEAQAAVEKVKQIEHDVQEQDRRLIVAKIRFTPRREPPIVAPRRPFSRRCACMVPSWSRASQRPSVSGSAVFEGDGVAALVAGGAGMGSQRWWPAARGAEAPAGG